MATVSTASWDDTSRKKWSIDRQPRELSGTVMIRDGAVGELDVSDACRAGGSCELVLGGSVDSDGAFAHAEALTAGIVLRVGSMAAPPDP